MGPHKCWSAPQGHLCRAPTGFVSTAGAGLQAGVSSCPCPRSPGEPRPVARLYFDSDPAVGADYSLLSSVTSQTVNSIRSNPCLEQRRTHSSREAPGALEGGLPAGWSGHRAGLEGNLTPDSGSGQGAMAELTRPQVAGGPPDHRPGSSHPYLMPLGEGGWRHPPKCSPLVWGLRGPGGEPRPSLTPSLDRPVQGLALGSQTRAHCLV